MITIFLIQQHYQLRLIKLIQARGSSQHWHHGKRYLRQRLQRLALITLIPTLLNQTQQRFTLTQELGTLRTKQVRQR